MIYRLYTVKYTLYCYILLRKFFCKMERMRRKEYERTYSEIVSLGTRTEARAASRTFMAPEYESTSQKNVKTPFPRAVQLSVLISSQGT